MNATTISAQYEAKRCEVLTEHRKPDLQGLVPESWVCRDCGVNTAPLALTMTSRRQRRADLADFRRKASHSLLTYLVQPGDLRLARVPLLRRAARDWLDQLAVRVRHCIVCSAWIVDRRDVGGLLLSVPATSRPTSAGTAAICRACWTSDLPIAAIERACATALKSIIPHGEFEPLGPRR